MAKQGEAMDAISTKPYLIRAIHEWCSDQGFTPYLAVVVDGRTEVPESFVQDGQIVLNVSWGATGSLKMENDYISFQARFGGVAQSVLVPVDNVVAIYARENGHGMAFEVAPTAPSQEGKTPVVLGALDGGRTNTNDADESAPDAVEGTPAPKTPARSHLKIVK